MKHFVRHKGPWVLAAAIALTLIVAALAVAFGGKAPFFSDWVGRVARPVQEVVSTVQQTVSNYYGAAFRYEELEEENRQLRKEIANMKADTREGKAATEENKRLRQLLELRERRRSFQFEDAKVLSHASTNWSDAITLNRGSDHGVEVGDCVVDAGENLVGIVSELGTNWCTMLTVMDASLEMGGQVARTEEVAVLEGDFSLMTQGKLKFTYLVRDADVEVGDEILTFSTEGVYPNGLVVGTVEEICHDPTGMTQYAVLRPTAELDDLTQVFIIKDFNLVE